MKLSDERIREIAESYGWERGVTAIMIKVANQALDEQIKAIADWLEKEADNNYEGDKEEVLNWVAKQLREQA